MRARKPKLTHKQAAAIPILLAAPTVNAAAKIAGIGSATLFRWLQNDAFDAAYRRARRSALGQAVAQLQQSSSVAVNALREIAEDQEAPSSARVSAARAVLEIAMRSIEFEDLDNRVAALERAAAEKAAAAGPRLTPIQKTGARA